MITSHLRHIRTSLDIDATNLLNNRDSSREQSAYNAIVRAIEWIDAELQYRDAADKRRWAKEDKKTAESTL